jgi:hypothetical protein
MSITDQIQGVIAKYDIEAKKYRLKYPKPDDLRNSVFIRTISVGNSGMISTLIMERYMTRGDFWDAILSIKMSDDSNSFRRNKCILQVELFSWNFCYSRKLIT